MINMADLITDAGREQGLSLETMTSEQETQFDTEMRALLWPFAQDGLLTFSVAGGITWGKPKSGEKEYRTGTIRRKSS